MCWENIYNIMYYCVANIAVVATRYVLLTLWYHTLLCYIAPSILYYYVEYKTANFCPNLDVVYLLTLL